MPLSDTTPTTVSLVEGDKLLYTGTCSMQVSISRADGGLTPLRVLPEGSFYEAPVTGDYVLTIKGSCCNVGDYEVFAADCCTGPDYEPLTVCDANTGTLWVQWVKIENDVITVLQDWTDTGRSCEAPTEVISDFCIKP